MLILTDVFGLGMKYPVAESDSFRVILAGIIPNAVDDDRGTLYVFELQNRANSTTTWWYDESTLSDTEGNTHDMGTPAIRGMDKPNADIIPDNWKTSPKVRSKTRTKVVTDLPDPGDEIVPRCITYDYDGEHYELELTEEEYEYVRDNPRDFVFEDWRTQPAAESFAIAIVDDVTESHVLLDTGSGEHGVAVPKPRHLEGSLHTGQRVGIDNEHMIQEVIDDGSDRQVTDMVVDSAPDIRYSDIGGLDDVIQQVREVVELPLERPEAFDRIGIDPPSGILLYGPPGTGKTLIAKAVAGETDATFISLSGSELAQKYVGEGSRLVRELFETADREAPAIVFIDEIDAIATDRSGDEDSASEEASRTMMQLLAKLDGFESRTDVRVVATTNRSDRLDPALLRPGRFDRNIEVSPPDTTARREIFELYLAPLNVDDTVDIEMLVRRSDGLTGADIESLCQEAGLYALREEQDWVSQDHLLSALQEAGGHHHRQQHGQHPQR